MSEEEEEKEEEEEEDPKTEGRSVHDGGVRKREVKSQIRRR